MKKFNFFAIALLFAGAVACNNAEATAEDAVEETEEVVEEAPEVVEEEVIEVVADSTATDSTAIEAAHDHTEGDDHDH